MSLTDGQHEQGHRLLQSFERDNYIATNRNTGSDDAALKLIKYWISSCRKSHKNTCNASSSLQQTGSRPMPTRLIDVGSPVPGSSSGLSPRRGSGLGTCSVRLVLPAELAEPQLQLSYIALSYCWGDGVRHSIELTDHNIEDLLLGLPEANLTKTH